MFPVLFGSLLTFSWGGSGVRFWTSPHREIDNEDGVEGLYLPDLLASRNKITTEGFLPFSVPGAVSGPWDRQETIQERGHMFGGRCTIEKWPQERGTSARAPFAEGQGAHGDAKNDESPKVGGQKAKNVN